MTLDAQRFAQGRVVGRTHRDRRRKIAVDPSVWIGSRDRSGASVRSARPNRRDGRADPPFEGMVALRSDGLRRLRDRDHHPGPDGFRSLNDCTRIWRDGRVEQLGWPRVKIHYRSGAGFRPGAAIGATDAAGRCSVSTWVEAASTDPRRRRLRRRLGLDPRRVEGRSSPSAHLRHERPAIIGRSGFGVIDHVGRAVCPTATRPPRAGACSSTARWAGTTRPASPTG